MKNLLTLLLLLTTSMIETATFPTGIETIAAVAGLAGAAVILVYSFTRNHNYEIRTRMNKIKQQQTEVQE